MLKAPNLEFHVQWKYYITVVVVAGKPKAELVRARVFVKLDTGIAMIIVVQHVVKFLGYQTQIELIMELLKDLQYTAYLVTLVRKLA